MIWFTGEHFVLSDPRRQHSPSPISLSDDSHPPLADVEMSPQEPSSSAAVAEAAKPKGGAWAFTLFLQAFIAAVALAFFFLFVGFFAIVLLHLCLLDCVVRLFGTISRPLDVTGGLSVGQLKELPLFECSSVPPFGTRPSQECVVCLESFQKGDRCRALPSCGHVFHIACIDQWLVTSPGCPICRACVTGKAP